MSYRKPEIPEGKGFENNKLGVIPEIAVLFEQGAHSKYLKNMHSNCQGRHLSELSKIFV